MKSPRKCTLLLFVLIGAISAPVPPLRAQASSADAEPHARAVLDQMIAGKFAEIEAQYDAAMKSGLPPGKLAEFWTQLNSQVGAFKSVAEATSQEIQGYHVVTLVTVFDGATLDTVISFAADGHIGGIRFLPHQPKVEWIAPAYAKQGSFSEQQITVTFQHWELPGTLTVPKGNGPFPLVVLVQGSGSSSDRDEAIGPNKPFKDLAWGIASRGVAVLRYTKRTVQYGIKSSDDPANFTVNNETVDDARAAVAIAAKQPDIDPKRIYVLGHSLGGYLAPRIADGDSQVAGLIIFAGSTRPMEQSVIDQVRYLASLAGLSADQVAKQVATAEQEARAIESSALKKGDMVDFLGTKIPASYFLDLRNYHPADVAAQLKIPILVLQGARDYQVTLADYDGWKKALAGHANATFKLYPGLTHLFAESSTPGTGLGTPQDYSKPGHVDEQVIGDIASWILSGGKKTQ